jgi:hypothetical protein
MLVHKILQEIFGLSFEDLLEVIFQMKIKNQIKTCWHMPHPRMEFSDIFFIAGFTLKKKPKVEIILCNSHC